MNGENQESPANAGLPLSYYQFVKIPFGDMVNPVLIAPVTKIIILNGFQNHLFFGFPQSDHMDYFQIIGQLQGLMEGNPVNGTDDASTKPFFNGAQQNTLARDAIVAKIVGSNARIQKYHNISPRAVTLLGPIPILQEGCP